ncbi:MAG: acyl-CoA thioesterase [Flavobacteriales bacterium]|nr:acyl-CoA thioesterase [Flavobacteriales bacterium]
MELLMTKVCMTKDIGVHGNLFGGIMLSWIDEAAVAMANRICKTPNMVTRKMTEILFERPVKVGYSINIYGKAVSMGNTSVALNLEARRYNVYTEEEVVVCTTTIVFVRIDEQGNKIPIAGEVRRMFAV